MKRTRARMLIKPKQNANNVYQLYIYDEVTAYGTFDFSTWTMIESETSADYFQKKLAEIPDNATIELYINSNGGYVDEGTAIYNQLVRHKAYKIGYVDGVAYSVASLILMSCNHIVMGLGTTMLVHEMWTVTEGNARQLRKTADDLDKMMESNRQIYMKRCEAHMSEDELIQLMEEERPLTPQECLEMGFCDEIGEVTGKQASEGNKPEDDNPKDDDLEGGAEPEEPEDDDPDGKVEENIKQFMATMFRQQTTALREEIKQQVNPVPKEPEDYTSQFLKQFLD